jgi:hypothetical protein
MYEARGGIVDDPDIVLLGNFFGESRPISIPVLLVGHHCWLVVVRGGGCATNHPSRRLCHVGNQDDSAKKKWAK